jgi:hypothetical protein
MPPDPKKPMEDLLKASAQTRRAEFGPAAQMPNPMRARLHDEIARVEEESANKAEKPRGLSIWWPRLALAGALAVVLVGGPVLWLHRGTRSNERTLQLAIREPAALSAPRADVARPAQTSEDDLKTEQPASPSLSTTPSIPNLEDNKMVAEASAPAARAAGETSSALQQFAAVSIPPEEAANANHFNEEQRLSKKAVPSAAVASAAVPGRREEVANFRQQFSQNSMNAAVRNQSTRFNSKLKRAISVLNTFQIEQNGTQIRVVDADGSAYTGQIEQNAPSESRERLKQSLSYAASSSTDAARRDKDAETNNVEFFFRASGYNGSLKKKLVFEGNYIGSPPLPGAKTARQQGVKSDQEQQVPARIVGTARISGESPVPIDATAVEP